MSKKIALNLTIKDLKNILSTVKKRKRKKKRLYKNIYQNNIKTDSSHMMGNTVFNRNNQNLANENLRAQYKLIEDNINKDKMKDDYEKLSLSVRNQNNRFTTDMYNMRNDLVDVQNQYNSFNTDFNTIKNQGFNAIQYVQNELNDLKNKYINDQSGLFEDSGGSDEFKGREDRLLISHETNINNNNDNNPTGLSEPIDTNINTVEENNRILSDQSNNMNSNQEAYETKEDDKQTKLKVPRKPRDKTQEQIEKMNDKQKQDYELSKLKYEYYTEYKKIHRNDIGKINKKILDSTDLNYTNKALKKFKKKNEIKLI